MSKLEIAFPLDELINYFWLIIDAFKLPTLAIANSFNMRMIREQIRNYHLICLNSSRSIPWPSTNLYLTRLLNRVTKELKRRQRLISCFKITKHKTFIESRELTTRRSTELSLLVVLCLTFLIVLIKMLNWATVQLVLSTIQQLFIFCYINKFLIAIQFTFEWLCDKFYCFFFL